MKTLPTLIASLLLSLPAWAGEVAVAPGPGALQRAIAGAAPGDGDDYRHLVEYQAADFET